MIAGHLYLDSNSTKDLLINKSAIYNILDHYNNILNVQTKNTPINSIYEDFKTNNLNKYPYNNTSNIIIINNDNANCIAAGLSQSSINIEYISFNIYPKKDGILNFMLHNPNYGNTQQLDYCLSNCYSFNVNSNKIDLSAFYIDNPQSFNYLFSQIQYNLSKDTLYNIKIEFNSNLYYCIEEQDLTVTDIIFPYL